VTDPHRELGLRTQALPRDLTDVYSLLQEASAWLRAQGSTQWNPVYPLERFAQEVEDGHVWCWKAGAAPLATVTLLPRRPDYYPAAVWDDGLPAWYVCRFTVKRTLAGRRVGETLLRQLEVDAAACGLQALRLDVVEASPFLERYYLARGFKDCGTVEIKDERSVLFERLVDARSC
jgi:ribosomal protein S18 acetylase RimI-like enzyme